MKNRCFNTAILLLLLLISACGKGGEKATATANTFVVKAEGLHKSLYFTGTVQPLQEHTLISPVEAIVESMDYHYGQLVNKDQQVLTLDSSELQKQYNDSLTEYLKAKDSYSMAKAKFTGTQELWEAGLLSKNNYMGEKSSVDTARIALMQATQKLTALLEKMGDENSQHLAQLSIDQFQQVRQALTAPHNLIRFKAPADGILLYPPKGNDDKSGQLSVGSAVKAGQVLALVGDLSGVRVEIDVPEIDIDKMHTGMDATITGVAMGQQVLHGKVVAVNAQATLASGGSLPSFNAIVEVRHLSKEARERIKVGMSASIALALDSGDKLLIPIAAVHQIKGQSVVSVRNAQGKFEQRVVVTGDALADKVAIIQGLHDGDVIQYG